MFCKHCGAEINDNAVVCVKCGCAVNDSVQTTRALDPNARIGSQPCFYVSSLEGLEYTDSMLEKWEPQSFSFSLAEAAASGH